MNKIEIVAWIELEYQHVVDPAPSPPIGIDRKRKEPDGDDEAHSEAPQDRGEIVPGVRGTVEYAHAHHDDADQNDPHEPAGPQGDPVGALGSGLQGGNSETIHGLTSTAVFQLVDHDRLSLQNQIVDLLRDPERRLADDFLVESPAPLASGEFVEFLEDLAEAGVVQLLVVLQEGQVEVVLAERQLEALSFSPGAVKVLCPLVCQHSH